MLNLFRGLLLASVLVVSGAAVAQDAPKGTVLLSQITLAQFGAGSGNDCWGYVSESGREYAIVGLNNQVAFVEITDPKNPVMIEQIPHGASTWGDIKVYRGFAYAVTERAGTGMQVIDMRDIDNGNVTLVRTIDLLSRAHNVVMDDVNGYVYTVGTRGGTGTTMCFSLADPSNPQLVGANSITAARYQHDAQVVTYRDGELAGRQIWYGFSEGRGVDIFDVTDKDNPVLIHRIEYPEMGYCHQGWVSEDLKYLYVDDEFDENDQNVTTRSLVFNIENPLEAFYVGAFTSGKKAIDHNQYLTGGFAFQANYRSGLRIFDTAANPEQPPQVGWFDTFTPNDDKGFDGAWSTYPFFPSGVVIVSDIQGGLIVLDVTGATTRSRVAAEAEVTVGTLVSGNTGSLALKDGQVMELEGRFSDRRSSRAILALTTPLATLSPMKATLAVDGSVNWGKANISVSFLNWSTGQYERRGSMTIGTAVVRREIDVTNVIGAYVHPQSRAVKVRLDVMGSTSGGTTPFRVKIDQFEIKTVR